MKFFLSFVIVLFSLSVHAQSIPAYKAEDVLQRISNPDTFYVVNFWATWCGPCVKELPEFDKLEKAFTDRPVKILLVSTDFKEDYPKKVANFIRRKKLSHEVIWLNESKPNEFIPKLASEWGGAIPATLLVYGKNQYRNFFEGSITAKQLQLLIDKQLAY
ncbi:MAG TPA: TlpA disulfide reductase family protein [Flavipsychrobacter sp.]|nr:TlpA disulfide reductase family protein [Flavipsychrobacter sp.]